MDSEVDVSSQASEITIIKWLKEKKTGSKTGGFDLKSIHYFLLMF